VIKEKRNMSPRSSWIKGIRVEKDVLKDTLKMSELFSALTDEELRPILELSRMEEYLAGEAIYEQDGIGVKLYVLYKGQVSLIRKFSLDEQHRVNATVYILRERPHRRIMGCWTNLVESPHVHLCTAMCDKPTKVVSIKCSDLREIIYKNHKTQTKILEKLILILRDRLESSYAAMETL
jgi:signal-transduction protein with cAMP-binding, CBS, and nucleotidyltransferase domain